MSLGVITIRVTIIDAKYALKYYEWKWVPVTLTVTPSGSRFTDLLFTVPNAMGFLAELIRNLDKHFATVPAWPIQHGLFTLHLFNRYRAQEFVIVVDNLDDQITLSSNGLKSTADFRCSSSRFGLNGSNSVAACLPCCRRLAKSAGISGMAYVCAYPSATSGE